MTYNLISRAAAIEAIGERPLNWTDTPRELQAISDWDGYIAALKSVPAVDAVPVVHGRWLECEDGWGDTHYQCSECGEEWNLDAGTPEENDMNYCPNCGAKMDGRENDG